ncbi:MAG: Ig-like domain-containing protein [Oscillospiraceae bacterium]|nr:Ig-like domain-containing protein [Oscillospiraceae bacterium]
MKKFLSLLLAVIMVIGMFPMSAMALELEQVGETEEIVETVEPAEEEQIENEETEKSVEYTIEPVLANAAETAEGEIPVTVTQGTETCVVEDTGLTNAILYGQPIPVYKTKAKPGVDLVLNETNADSGNLGRTIVDVNGSSQAIGDVPLTIPASNFSYMKLDSATIAAYKSMVGDPKVDESKDILYFVVKDSKGNYLYEMIVEVEKAVATSVSLDKTEIVFSSDYKTETLVATTDVAGAEITWSSSDEKVATVTNKGVVTATGLGEAIITASSGEAKAECKVKVENINATVNIYFSPRYNMAVTIYTDAECTNPIPEEYIKKSQEFDSKWLYSLDLPDGKYYYRANYQGVSYDLGGSENLFLGGMSFTVNASEGLKKNYFLNNVAFYCRSYYAAKEGYSVSVSTEEAGIGDVVLGDTFKKEGYLYIPFLAIVQGGTNYYSPITYTYKVDAELKGELAKEYYLEDIAECSKQSSTSTFMSEELILKPYLSVDRSSAMLSVGGTVALAVECADSEAAITYSSSDEKIATVSAEGVITAVAAGKAIITVSDGTHNREVEVTVKAEASEYNEIRVEVAPSTAEVVFYVDADAKTPLSEEFIVDRGEIGGKRIYTLYVKDGVYSYRATENGQDLGGASFIAPVEEEILSNGKPSGEGQVLNLLRINWYTTSELVTSVGDYTINFKPGALDYCVNGKQYIDGNGRVVTPMMIVAGGSRTVYQAEIILKDELEENYGAVVAGNMVFGSASITTQNKTFNVVKKVDKEITAPEGADVKVFIQLNNFNVKEVARKSVVDNGDGTVTHLFKIAQSDTRASYRVSMEGKITKASFLSGSAQKITVTFEENEDPKSTENIVSENMQKRMESSTLVNINARNNLVIDEGEEFRLRAYRAAWQIINGDTTNIMIEPDFNYEIISGGEHIKLSPVTDKCTGNAGTGEKSNWMDITGVSKGVAIIEVSYDALGTGTGSTIYGATDPNRTSLVVVSVGGSGKYVEITADGSGNVWDTEYDTVYFTGETGKLAFTAKIGDEIPEKAELSVDKGKTWKEISISNGKFIADELVSGNNIIRFKTGDEYVYQVVRAAKVTYTVTNLSREGEIIYAGDTVQIKFNGLYIPVPKFSGIYNPGFGKGHRIVYNAPESADVTSSGGQYTFITDHIYKVTFNEGGEFVFDGGYIAFNVMGTADPEGAHRKLGDSGTGTNFNAVSTEHTRSVLPEIAIAVADCENGTHIGGTATCTDKAICKACGKEYGEALGHTAEGDKYVAATCTSKAKCGRCGEEYGEALGHDEVEHEAKEPTCTEIGWDAYVTCTRCDYSTYAEKEALGHDEVEHEAKDPTCTEIGWDAYVTCSRCDYSTYAEKAELGHDMADATCTEPSTCKRGCGHTEGEALGHKFGSWVTVEEPTETEGGRAVKTCSVCGHQTSKYVKPLSEDGITIIVPGEKSEDESNPNTGAPVESVSALCAMAVLAGMAIVLKKIK